LSSRPHILYDNSVQFEPFLAVIQLYKHAYYTTDSLQTTLKDDKCITSGEKSSSYGTSNSILALKTGCSDWYVVGGYEPLVFQKLFQLQANQKNKIKTVIK